MVGSGGRAGAEIRPDRTDVPVLNVGDGSFRKGLTGRVGGTLRPGVLLRDEGVAAILKETLGVLKTRRVCWRLKRNPP